MPFVNRRVFYGKVGAAFQLIDHLRDAEKLFKQYGANFKTRILSDYNSGRTDRVVWEYEVDDLAAIDATLNKMMSDPQGQAGMEAWFEKLKSLIDQAEVENWNVH